MRRHSGRERRLRERSCHQCPIHRGEHPSGVSTETAVDGSKSFVSYIDELVAAAAKPVSAGRRMAVKCILCV